MEIVRVDSLMDAVGRDGIFLSGGTEILRLNTGVDKNSPLIDILPLLSDEIINLDSPLPIDGREHQVGIQKDERLRKISFW